MTFQRTLRTSQPSGKATVDWSNNITRGLRAAILPSLNNEVINNAGVDKSGVGGTNIEFASGQSGNGARRLGGNAGQQGWRWIGEWSRPTAEMTIVTIHKFNEIPTGTARVAANYENSALNGYMIGPDASGNRFVYVAGGVQTIVYSPYGLNLREHVIVGRVTGSNISIFEDGNHGQTSSISSVGIPQNNAIHILGDKLSSSPGINGTVFGVFLFHRALSNAEIRSISENPWQIFSNVKKPIFVGATETVFTAPKIAYPSSDTSPGAWKSTVSSLYDAVNESNRDDDYIYATSASECSLALPAAPNTSLNQSITFRGKSDTMSTLTITMKNATNQTVLTWVQPLTATLTTYKRTLTQLEISSINNGSTTVTIASS